MNQKEYETLVTNMINAMAKRIFELASQGYSKGQILEYLKSYTFINLLYPWRMPVQNLCTFLI